MLNSSKIRNKNRCKHLDVILKGGKQYNKDKILHKT